MKHWNKRTKIVATVVGAVIWGTFTSFGVWLGEMPSFLYAVVAITSVLAAYTLIRMTIRGIW